MSTRPNTPTASPGGGSERVRPFSFLIEISMRVRREPCHNTIYEDEGTLVIVLPLAEAKALLEEPLGMAVCMSNAFVLCDCDACTSRLTRDLDNAGRALHPIIVRWQ